MKTIRGSSPLIPSHRQRLKRLHKHGCPHLSTVLKVAPSFYFAKVSHLQESHEGETNPSPLLRVTLHMRSRALLGELLADTHVTMITLGRFDLDVIIKYYNPQIVYYCFSLSFFFILAIYYSYFRRFSSFSSPLALGCTLTCIPFFILPI